MQPDDTEVLLQSRDVLSSTSTVSSHLVPRLNEDATLRFEITGTSIFAAFETEATFRLFDFEFVSGEDQFGPHYNPCALTDVLRCQADGGGYFNDSGRDIVLDDGTVLVDGGCYEEETCVNSPYTGVCLLYTSDAADE